MKTISDPDATQRRRDELAAYYERAVLSPDPEFICASASKCIASAAKPGVGYYEGALPYLGRHYDMELDGASARVLVVPMEVGGEWRRKTMDDFTSAMQLRINQRFSQRNNHMRGVTLAVRLALGLELGDDRSGEFLQTPDGPVHVLDAYAMFNVVMCSALQLNPATGEPTTTSRQTHTMRRSCFRHLRRAIEVLEPTILISQGTAVGKHLGESFTSIRWHSDTVARCTLTGHSYTWVKLAHPTARAPLSWSWLSHPYLHDVVEPSIALARELSN